MAQRRTDFDLDLEERGRALDAWVEKKRQIAALECEAMGLLVDQISIHDADVAGNGFHRDAIYRSMVAEFSAAGRIPQGSIEFAFTDARTVSGELPAVWEAFAAGRISASHVREICRASAIVSEAIRNKKADADVMGLYEAAVLVFAERETAARTGAHAAQVAAALVGETVTDRHKRAAGERGVTVRSVGDGLALLTAVLPEWLAVAIAGTTLTGADDRPAELDGHGPIHPDIARDLAGRNTGWSRLFLDPDGMVTQTDTYTPTEQMRRFLRARDQHCRFPGCRMPVHRCDIDHNHDHARGGKTQIDNLAHLCRRHHTLKHPDIPDTHRWTAHQERDGTITWHSPLGRDYTDRPTHRVMFI